MLIEKEKTLPSPPLTLEAPPQLPQPPPYSAQSFPIIQAPPPLPLAAKFETHAVNQLHINNRKEDVLGTFCIDTLLPVPLKNKGKGKGSSVKAPDASFRSRHGAVSLNLATSGLTAERTKAYVQVATRKGDVNINLFSLQTGRTIHLDVYSRGGHVLVLIPRTFCGGIQLRSRKKGYKILPALALASRALTTTDRETLILIGDPSPGSAHANEDISSDFCQLQSRSGKVIVGFSGEDKYEPNERGFWKKLFGGS